MTEEEYFRKNYPNYCYGFEKRPLSPYWDLFQDGVEFGERQTEKKIEVLEKENAVLKSECRICVYTDIPCLRSDYPSKNGVCSHYKNVFERNAELKKQLEDADNTTDCFNRQEEIIEHAKKLLNEFMRISKASDEDFEHDYSELIGETEQFIKEIK